MKRLLRLNPNDNVLITLEDIDEGQEINFASEEFITEDFIPSGHKMALRDIAAGGKVIRYGYPIGCASKAIRAGQWVHVHNLTSELTGKLAYKYQPDSDRKEPMTGNNHIIPTFVGWERQDGQYGIRNEIWIISLVGCINHTAARLARLAEERFGLQMQNCGVDGIYHFGHPFGCSQLGSDLDNTQRILAGLMQHPNASGVLAVGLGCENNQVNELKRFLPAWDPLRIKFLLLQEVEDEFETGMELLSELLAFAGRFRPKNLPVSGLKIGLKCGGSDGFSGISANPLVGEVADRLVGYGGSVILTEVPEMFGAETILMNRACDLRTFSKIERLITGFKDYYIKNGYSINENPAPGNKTGGITTLEEKSLGCILKGGHSVVMDVIQYGQPVKVKGLNLLEGPGNDLVSSTALVASGAQLLLFTTGRGNPLGTAVPTVKIASNSAVYHHKPHWFDFNAGSMLEGESRLELGNRLWDVMIEIASKKQVARNEAYGYREIAIFKNGVTL